MGTSCGAIIAPPAGESSYISIPVIQLRLDLEREESSAGQQCAEELCNDYLDFGRRAL